MDMSNVCKLISKTYEADEYGVPRESETEAEVFCNVRSVSGTEWHNAGRNGIKAEYQITVFKYDYNGEEIIELNGVRYGIYRTYDRTDDNLELYLRRQAGA